MDVRITVETTFENGKKSSHDLGHNLRPLLQAQPESFRFLLKDARTLLRQLREAMLLDQIEEISKASRSCSACNKARAIHNYRLRVLDTLFGRFRVRLPRIRRCTCTDKPVATSGGPNSLIAHFFPDRATTELSRLQAELGSRHSFREAARIMETFLPCATQLNTTVRNPLGRIAKEISDREQSVPAVDVGAPSPPLTVFLDGAHIRCRPKYQKRHLDLVVGKIESPDRSRRFDLAQQAVRSPANKLRQDLCALGWDDHSLVTVISDGEPALPNLVRRAVQGPVRHILDCWHISMRVQHVATAVKGLLQTDNFPGMPELFKRPSETLRWCLWHGKIMPAGTRLQCLMIDCFRLSKEDARVRVAAA